MLKLANNLTTVINWFFVGKILRCVIHFEFQEDIEHYEIFMNLFNHFV